MDNGALNSYVRRHRDLSRRQLLSFCTDIASGMTYLAKNNVFHRDLAARNCLLDADLSVKGNTPINPIRANRYFNSQWFWLIAQ